MPSIVHYSTTNKVFVKKERESFIVLFVVVLLSFPKERNRMESKLPDPWPGIELVSKLAGMVGLTTFSAWRERPEIVPSVALDALGVMLGLVLRSGYPTSTWEKEVSRILQIAVSQQSCVIAQKSQNAENQ